MEITNSAKITPGSNPGKDQGNSTFSEAGPKYSEGGQPLFGEELSKENPIIEKKGKQRCGSLDPYSLQAAKIFDTRLRFQSMSESSKQ